MYISNNALALNPASKKNKILAFLLISLAFISLLATFIYQSMHFVNSFNDPAWVERFLSTKLHQVVKIEHISSQWQDGQPVIKIDNLAILNQTKPLLAIKHLHFGIDLVATFLRCQLMVGEFLVDGSKIFLYEKPGGRLLVNNIPALELDLKTTSKEKINYVITSLLTSGNKTIKNVSIKWYNQAGMPVLPETQLNLKAKSHFIHHQYKGTIHTSNQDSINIEGKAFGSWLARPLLYFSASAKASQLNLASIALISYLNHTLSLKGTTAINFSVISQPYRALSLNGWFDSSNFALQVGQKIFDADRFRSFFNVEYRAGRLALSLKNANWLIKDQQFAFKLIELNQTKREETTQQTIKIDQFQLSPVVKFIKKYQFLPAYVQNAVDQMKPSGVITDFEWSRSNRVAFTTLQGNMFNVDVAPWRQIPGFKHFNGAFSIWPKGGKLSVNTTNTLFSYQPLFRFPIMVKRAAAQVRWNQDSRNQTIIKIKNVKLKLTMGQAWGSMLIKLRNATSPYVNAKFQFNLTDASQLLSVYPVTTTPASVVDWLGEAIKGGRVEKGLFILSGKIADFPFDSNEGKFIIKGNLYDGYLHYLEGWPDIDHLRARLLFKGRSMDIQAPQASMLGATLSTVHATIQDLEKALLTVNGKISTKSQIITLGSASNPISTYYKTPWLKEIKLQGPWQALLSLSLPLDDTNVNRLKFSSQIHMAGVNLTSTTPFLSASHLQGDLIVHQNYLSSSVITGIFAQQPFNLLINATDLADGKETTINWRSQIAIEQVKQWLGPTPWLDALEGKTSYQATVKMKSNENQFISQQFDLTSNLLGLQSALPMPFNKEAQEALDSSLELKKLASKTSVNFLLSHRLNGQLIFKPNGSKTVFDRGIIHLGDEKLPLPSQKGLTIAGYLAEFNLAKWKLVFSKQQVSGKSVKDHLITILPWINQLVLQVGHLQLAQFELKQALLDIKPSKDVLTLAINSQQVTGKLNYYIKNTLTPLIIQLKSLELDKLPLGSAMWQPGDLLPMLVNITQLRYGNFSLKNINVNVKPEGNSLKINEIKIADDLLKFSANGKWLITNGQHQTNLNGHFESNNLGALLFKWKITDNVVKGRGVGDFNLNWQGAAYEPSLNTLSGSLKLAVEKGRIIKLNNQANIGMGVSRILTLFSLQNLPRRLMLDFSDLTTPGFSFDEITAALLFQKGQLYMDNAIISGPQAKVKVKGRIGLKAKDYNLNLSINPYATSSLPVVATLTAGPIVGAATWLIDKVLSHQVKKLTEIHYNVTGTWDKPNLIDLTQPLNEKHHE